MKTFLRTPLPATESAHTDTNVDSLSKHLSQQVVLQSNLRSMSSSGAVPELFDNRLVLTIQQRFFYRIFFYLVVINKCGKTLECGSTTQRTERLD